MARGSLRIYLGAAPGVGKTFAMLDEGWRRRTRGTDVVVGFVETHGRPNTQAQVRDLEVVPRHPIEYRGAAFEEMDVEAALARRPAVALVDELAHTNVPGSRNAKRWQDVEELLDAGIDVLSTVNIQHLESLNDVVERITGIRQQETVPDSVVRRAEQVELVDMTPEALRRRMAHGNIYAPEKVDAALANYFRVGNLTALREIALLWLADQVEEAVRRYQADHEIGDLWETRERVVVALTGGPEGETLVRRAARIAARGKGELLAVHVARRDGLADASPAALATQRTLVEALGGTYHEVSGDDEAETLLGFAREQQATQLVLGASRRSRVAAVLSPGIAQAVIRDSGPIDVHIVTHEYAATQRGLPDALRPRFALSARRRAAGFALAVGGLPLLTLLLAQLREDVGLPGVLLLFLSLVVACAIVGGALPAMVCAVGGFLLVNYYFTPPIHTWTIAARDNVLALVVFVVIGGVVSVLVDLAERREAQASRSQAEAEALAAMARGVLAGKDALPGLLEHLLVTFALDGVAVLRRVDGQWHVEASAGHDVPYEPDTATHRANAADGTVVALNGRPLSPDDQRVLAAFVAQVGAAVENRRLAREAAEAASLGEANRLRTALLNAVSHDLRTPLASIKAAVTSLLQQDVEWSDDDVRQLLETISESTDRLNGLVGNLLDMSRLQTGAVNVLRRPIGLDEVVPSAVASLGSETQVVVDVPETLPRVDADPGLLERAVANLVGNALAFAPAGVPPRLTASAHDGRVELRVIDQGPGVPPAARDRIFEPFQRLGDRDNASGVGLGLAVARGFAEVMGGSLEPEDTPGGGLTMVLTLPQAAV
ncbi:MAG: two-component system, OmpR family, sensor histidine kinase KdpD [Frankiaceae bacterium]|nr:two-component system, OmpR family, sensor histidine kinase KdpD [Frankiaceae bacterium]